MTREAGALDPCVRAWESYDLGLPSLSARNRNPHKEASFLQNLHIHITCCVPYRYEIALPPTLGE